MGMERDFLGMKNFKDVAQQLHATKCSEQQCVLSKTSPEGRSVVNYFSHLPSSGFQLIHSSNGSNANHASTIGLPSQKSFIIDWQGTHPFRTDPAPSGGTKTFDTMLHPANNINNFPVASNYITFNQIKVKGAVNGSSMAATHTNWQEPCVAVGSSLVGSTHNAINTRTPSMTQAATAQMTIFYAGRVNVYDNIPLDKAHEIMSLASGQSIMHSNMGNIGQNILHPTDLGHRAMKIYQGSVDKNMELLSNAANMGQKVHGQNEVVVGPINIKKTLVDRNMESRSSDPASPVSVTSHFVSGMVMPDMGQNIIDIRAGGVFNGPSLINALPMARKASLARFLKKRKERLAISAPYMSSLKSDNNVAIDGAKASNKSVMDIATNGTCLGMMEARSPNTKLEI